MGWAITAVSVAEESPFTVGRGEEAEVAVEGIAVGGEGWGVFKSSFGEVGWWQGHKR